MATRLSSRRHRARRVSWFESIESRLLLSGNPLALNAADYVDISQPAAGDFLPLFDGRQLSGQGQTAAIIDSGIAYSHAALGGGYGSEYRVVGGYDFTAGRDGDPYDDGPYGAHGTHVAGILASQDATYPGLAPGADLVALRVFDNAGHGSFRWVEEALQWVHDNRFAFENPITTVNLSLGAAWGADGVPDWAILEDELALLESDGIFIAVAAGNGFDNGSEPGLSYPAVSEHVVPVGALDSNGQLSYFSQRDMRMIAAPGRGIRSTVPDYLGNGNGIDDDFARFSGTSMATPYVAAASMLLREAYELAGVSHVSQGMLYDVMLDSADVIHDSHTGIDFHRLDLAGAIDVIAGMTTPEQPPAAPQEPVAPTQPEPEPVAPEPVAPQPIVPEPQPPASIDWGTIRQTTFDGYSVDADGLKATFTATANGILSAEAFFAHATADVDLELFDGQGTLVGVSRGMGDSERIDIVVSAGDTFTLSAVVYGQGTAENVSFRLTNLMEQEGRTVRIGGTAGDDQFVFAAAAEHQVSVNGVEYRFGASNVDLVILDAAAGSDTAVLTGSNGADVATLRPTTGELRGPGYRVQTVSIESTTVRAGGGSDDVTFHDSAADDRFTATTDSAEMSGSGYTNRAEGFQNVRAFAAAGGNDLAELFDSAGNDHFVATPASAMLYGEGFFHHVRQFEQVRAHATGGGTNIAKLFDSAGDDRLTMTEDSTSLSGAGYSNRAEHFDAVHAYATAGGEDTATISQRDEGSTLVREDRSAIFSDNVFSDNVFSDNVFSDNDFSDNDFSDNDFSDNDFSDSDFFAEANFFEHVLLEDDRPTHEAIGQALDQLLLDGLW